MWKFYYQFRYDALNYGDRTLSSWVTVFPNEVDLTPFEKKAKSRSGSPSTDSTTTLVNTDNFDNEGKDLD